MKDLRKLKLKVARLKKSNSKISLKNTKHTQNNKTLNNEESSANDYYDGKSKTSETSTPVLELQKEFKEEVPCVMAKTKLDKFESGSKVNEVFFNPSIQIKKENIDDTDPLSLSSSHHQLVISSVISISKYNMNK